MWGGGICKEGRGCLGTERGNVYVEMGIVRDLLLGDDALLYIAYVMLI